MINHPGQPITIHNISQLIGHAYPLAFTPKNISAGFSVSGIYPFNPDVFSEEDFLSSYVTDRQLVEDDVPSVAAGSSVWPPRRIALPNTLRDTSYLKPHPIPTSVLSHRKSLARFQRLHCVNTKVEGRRAKRLS